MNTTLRSCCFLFILVFLKGCLAEYENVSKDSRFNHLIGTKYKTLIVLKIHGITYPKSNSKAVYQYDLTEAPGIAGREVIERRDLVIGSIIQIKAVMKCANCLPASIEFVIDIISGGSELKSPIWMRDLSIKNNQGKVVMDPKKLLLISD